MDDDLPSEILEPTKKHYLDILDAFEVDVVENEGTPTKQMNAKCSGTSSSAQISDSFQIKIPSNSKHNIPSIAMMLLTIVISTVNQPLKTNITYM